jgi:hypothetical protein
MKSPQTREDARKLGVKFRTSGCTVVPIRCVPDTLPCLLV